MNLTRQGPKSVREWWIQQHQHRHHHHYLSPHTTTTTTTMQHQQRQHTEGYPRPTAARTVPPLSSPSPSHRHRLALLRKWCHPSFYI
ncbi:hypothetical protein E2C01_014725 [Portunus trituberculatus]|uniref:Uncharacterized protein n=1 Tax=Portunus trituberculatus TaxID=210409 RepID=A0A5B7DJK5_PORTR|nr:hypothetical protein [Portunus trituberculatus]